MSNERNDDTRVRIKNAAQRLFGERGIDKVSVRDILAAAGQRHIGAIGYYFQNKESLVREILIDGARVLELRRNTLLDELEARQNGITLRDVMSVIIRPCIDLRADPEGETYSRFFSIFQRSNSNMFLEVVSSHHDRGYRRCVAHLRRLLPDLPRKILNERIIFMMLMVGTILSARETALEQNGGSDVAQVYGGRMWSSATLIDNLIDACVGVFLQPKSPA